MSQFAVITGGSAGVGLATVEVLMSKGWNVIIGCRDIGKAKNAIERIKSKHASAPEPFVFPLDLAEKDSIESFVKEVNKIAPALKLLINNAAYIGNAADKTSRVMTSSGFEQTFATNYLGHVILTNMLYPNLLAAAPSRVVNVAALAHKMFTLHREDLQLSDSPDYSPINAYAHSKIMNILFTLEFEARYGAKGVTAVAAHPGIILDTEISRHFDAWWLTLLRPMVPILGRIGAFLRMGTMCTVEDAGQGIVTASEHPAGGTYFEVGVLADLSGESINEDNAKWLWQETERITGITWPS